jgi:hypothetical protein
MRRGFDTCKRGLFSCLAVLLVFTALDTRGAHAGQARAVFHVGLRIAPRPVLPVKSADTASARQRDEARTEAPVLKARVPVVIKENGAKRTLVRLVFVY